MWAWTWTSAGEVPDPEALREGINDRLGRWAAALDAGEHLQQVVVRPAFRCISTKGNQELRALGNRQRIGVRVGRFAATERRPAPSLPR